VTGWGWVTWPHGYIQAQGQENLVTAPGKVDKTHPQRLGRGRSEKPLLCNNVSFTLTSKVTQSNKKKKISSDVFLKDFHSDLAQGTASSLNNLNKLPFFVPC
jgi:hypothetical protein